MGPRALSRHSYTFRSKDSENIMSDRITVFLGEAIRKQLDDIAVQSHRPRAEIMRMALVHFFTAEKWQQPILLLDTSDENEKVL